MKHRLFIAIDLPPSHHPLVVRLQEDLGRLGLPVRWEPTAKLHLTLNFLGKVDDSSRSSLEKAFRQVAASTSPFSLTPAFLETLYRRHEASLIFLGFQGDATQLKQLQKSLSRALTDLSLPQPQRFLPHLTIGRLMRADPTTTKSQLDKFSHLDFSPLPSFTVDRLVLYESLLSRSGSTYQKMASFMLQSSLP